MMEGTGIQLFTLALAAFYCAVVYAFRMSPEGGKAQRERYERLALALAALTVGLAAAKAVALLGGTAGEAFGTGSEALKAGSGAFNAGAAAGVWGLSAELAAGAAAVALGTAIVAVQTAAIRAAGAAALQKELAEAVVQTKRSTIALAALVGAPMVLLITGGHPVRDEVMAYLLAAEAVALSIFFIVRTFGLFVRQKVSVLVWILYLCSVEVVPAWTVIVLAARAV